MNDQHLENFFISEKRHALREGYMNGCKSINSTMRCIIVNWIYETFLENETQKETIFLAIAILDKYISISTNIDRNNFQLVGITCVWVASKFIQTTWFTIENYLEFCNKRYAKSELELMEMEILTKLQWDINFTTSYHFLKNFKRKFGLTKKEYCLCKYLLEFILHYSVLMDYLPSTLAATTICMMVMMNVKSNAGSVGNVGSISNVGSVSNVGNVGNVGSISNVSNAGSVINVVKEKTWNFYISKTKILEVTKQDDAIIEGCIGKVNILLLKEMILIFNKKENKIKFITQNYHNKTNDGPSDKVYLWYSTNDNLDNYECE
jgi:hypothetical protein